MAHAGRPASRHGRYDAFRTEFTSETATDELPSQSVFSYDGTEDVRRARENPTVHRQRSGTKAAMAQGVIPSGPLVAVHMFDVSSDKSDSRDESPSQATGLRRWSREALDGSDGCPPASPRPPSTPRLSRPGSMRRRSNSGQRPPSGQSRRPVSSRKTSRENTLDQEELLPPMATLRPQSSLGKYLVLPSISPTQDSLHPDVTVTQRSDGSEDQRGMEEAEYLAARMAQHALAETVRRESRDSVDSDRLGSRERPLSRDGRDHESRRNSAQGSRDHSGYRDGLTRRHSAQGKRDYSGKNNSSGGHAELGQVGVPSSCSSSKTTSPEPFTERSHTSISQYRMDEAPKPSSEDQVLLGIKIPTDGTRHKHYFNGRDQLRCIVLFAEEVSGEDFSNHILVLATPRQRFDNLSQTIQAAGLQSKSVLHLEETD